MKIEEVLKYESLNQDSIFLFKEGIFLRAYERSAMRFTEYIADFKVFKKHYKIVNADVCYLGFPYNNFKILFEKNGIAHFAETEQFVIVYNCPSKNDFNVWKEQVQLPTVEDVKPQLLLRPNVKQKDLKNLQIYKNGYDIMLELHRYVETMPRAHRYTIGERIKNESIELSLLTYQIGKDKDVTYNKQIAGDKIEIIRLLLRLMSDLKRISQSYFITINKKLEHLYLSLIQ